MRGGAVLGLIGLAGCAQVLGIEETQLAPAADPCRYVPERVYFAEKPSSGSELTIGLISESELVELGGRLGEAPRSDRGHVLVRALDCYGLPAEDVSMQLRLGDSAMLAEAAGIVIDDSGPLLGSVTSGLGLVGALNAPTDTVLSPWLFPGGIDDQESAIGDLVVRPGSLASIDLPPNSEVEADPVPSVEPWTCVGTIEEPIEPGPGTVHLVVTVVAAPGLVVGTKPIAGVSVHACVDSAVPCEQISERVTAVTDASGRAELDVESDTGLFDGFLLVEGTVPGCG
jgi:hypothetical protein